MYVPPKIITFILQLSVMVVAGIGLYISVEIGWISDATEVPRGISDFINIMLSMRALYFFPVVLIALLFVAVEVRDFKPARRIAYLFFNFIRGFIVGKIYFMGVAYFVFSLTASYVSWIPRLSHGVLIPIAAVLLGWFIWNISGWAFRKMIR